MFTAVGIQRLTDGTPDFLGVKKGSTLVRKHMSISPQDWGARYWATIHSVAFWYPTEPTPQQKKAAYDFYTSLVELLPCGGCRDHYAELLQTYPLESAVINRTTLLKWTVDVHNAISASYGKAPMPFEVAVMNIERDNQPGRKPSMQMNPQNAAAILAIGAVVGALLAGYRPRLQLQK